MKIDLRTLPEHGTTLAGELEPHAYDLPTEEGQSWEPLRYQIFVQVLGTECLVVGRIESTLHTPCGRCLESLQHPVVVEKFEHSFEAEGLEMIDLTLQIREDIMLGLPLVIRCVLEADGRCPVTGHIHGQEADPEPSSIQEDVWGALDKWKEQ
jgi:uncharacterized metal-binding protein YceD (DUF177 family)